MSKNYLKRPLLKINMIRAYSPKKSVFYIIFFNILGKPLGLLTSVLMAYYFGTGKDLDAFLWSSTFLVLATGMVVGCWPLVIIPILTTIESKDRDQAQGYISALLSYGTLLILVIGICIYLFAGNIVNLLTNFEITTNIEAVNILRSMVLYFVFNSIYQIEQAVFNTYRNFKTPAFLVFLSRILVIISLVIFTNFIYINSLVLGRTLAALLQFSVTLYIILKMRIAFSLRLSCEWKWIRQTLIMLLPFYVTETFHITTEIFYRYKASGLNEGALSYLNYGCLIKDLTVETLAGTLSIVMFTEFSRSHSTNDLRALKNSFYKSIFTVWYMIIPISTFLFFFGDILIVLLFKRGAFNNESAINSYKVLQILSIGLFAWGGHYFTNKAFFSFHDTITPLIVTIPNTFIIIILYYYFSQWLSITGITLALTISGVWCFWLYLFVLHQKHLKMKISKFFIKLIELGTISFFCFGILKYSVYKNYNPFESSFFQLLLNISIALFVPTLSYLLLTYFMKIPEAINVYGYSLQAKDLIINKIRRYYDRVSITTV